MHEKLNQQTKIAKTIL